MATTKSMKIQAEIDKVKAKISEQQARLKELEQKKLEAENSEIVDIVRGMSISLTELPLLFERFHKADRSRSADRESWGLGLYIVKTILDAHGEDIRAESHDGVTTFRFTLSVVR